MLLAAGFPVEGKEELDTADGLSMYILSAGGEELKRFCVKIEESLPIGRLLDLDITCGDKPIGRNELKLPPRRCFICDETAACCVVSRRHSREELESFIERKIAVTDS